MSIFRTLLKSTFQQINATCSKTYRYRLKIIMTIFFTKKLLNGLSRMPEDFFKTEDRKYSLLWQDSYKEAHWKKLASKLIEQYPPHSSLIDFGFGNGSALRYFQNKGYQVTGVDISSYAVRIAEPHFEVYHSSLDNIKFIEDKKFTIGFCNDVIEHVPEFLVLASLKEMARVCRQSLFISVCPTLSHHLSHDGENLHLTVKDKTWWEEQLNQIGIVRKFNFMFSRSLRYQVILNQSINQ